MGKQAETIQCLGLKRGSGTMPNFNAFETYSLFHPFGIFIHVVVLAFAAWLCAIARGWPGWTAYVVLTILIISPALLVLTACLTATRCDLGSGIAILATGPLALAWLLGSLLGLPFRFRRGRSPQSG